MIRCQIFYHHPGPAKSKQCREVELALCFLCGYVNNGMYAVMGTVGATAQ